MVAQSVREPLSHLSETRSGSEGEQISSSTTTTGLPSPMRAQRRDRLGPAVPTFEWDVLVPGEDLPHRLSTDYLVSEGEEITVDGREWLVERVDIIEGDDETATVPTGIIAVVSPR